MICWLPYAILFRYLLNLLLKQRLKQGSQEAAGLSIGLFLDRKITNNDFINTVFVVKQRYKSEFFHYYKKWVSNKQTLQKAVGYVLCWLSVCVCVCVCVYVFILFHLLLSFGCTTSVTYMRCSDQRSFVVSIIRNFCQVPSYSFPSLSYFTSKDVTPACRKTGEKTIWYTAGSAKRWYILI